MLFFAGNEKQAHQKSQNHAQQIQKNVIDIEAAQKSQQLCKLYQNNQNQTEQKIGEKMP